MKTVAIVVAILIILLVVVLVVLAARRNRRRTQLRERFGPEYDLAVRRGKDRRAAEQRLEALAEQRDSLQIRDVAVEEHERFARQWADVQGRFVDDPGQAVADADGLVNAVLRSRGYPVESFDDRVALVATDHQDVVEGYRRAHDTFAAHLRGGSEETESLRQAFLHYREVFTRLDEPAAGERDASRAVGAGDEHRTLGAGDEHPAVGAGDQHRAVEAAPSAEAAPSPAGPVSPADATEDRPMSAPAPAVAAEPAPAEAPTPEPGPRIAADTPAGVPPAMPPTVVSVPADRPTEAASSEPGDDAASRVDENRAEPGPPARSGAQPPVDRP